jgi:hypothetical protein
VDKERKFFKRIMFKGLWWRDFNLLLLVLGQFNFCGRFLERDILYMGKDPFPLGRCGFNLKNFWEVRVSEKLITRLPRVITV